MDSNKNHEGQNKKTTTMPMLPDRSKLIEPDMSEKDMEVLERRLRIADQFGAKPTVIICKDEKISLATYYKDLEWIRKYRAQEWVDEMGKDRLIFDFKEMANQMKTEREILWDEVYNLRENKRNDKMYSYHLTRYLQQINDTLRLEKEFLGDVPTLHALKEAVKHIAKGAKGLAGQT